MAVPEAVREYYIRLNDGYLNDLDGNCHFGFDPGNEPYDRATAQHNMQCLMGSILNLPPGSKVLDAGCGFGPVSRTLASEFNLDVVGIDLMPERLAEAQKRNTEQRLGTILLSGADYHHLPFPNEIFKAVVTMETLVHANPVESVLSEFKRVLEPGGVLVNFEYSIPDLASLNPAIRYLANMVIDSTGMSSLPRFTHGAFSDILEQAGFENIDTADVSRYVWSSWRHLWGNALKHTGEDIFSDNFEFKNIRGCTMIYPARHHLGYVVSRAQKPQYV